jgi:hypothetical protein
MASLPLAGKQLHLVSMRNCQRQVLACMKGFKLLNVIISRYGPDSHMEPQLDSEYSNFTFAVFHVWFAGLEAKVESVTFFIFLFAFLCELLLMRLLRMWRLQHAALSCCFYYSQVVFPRADYRIKHKCCYQ